MKNTNQLDTIDFAIPFQYCNFDCCMATQGSAIGAEYCIEKDRFHFNLSSKIFATEKSLGEITIQNIEEITQKIKALFEVEINTEYLCTQAEMYRIHTKKDLTLDNHASAYMPYINASFKRNSDKFILNKFKGLTYEHGLTAHPKTNKKFKYSIYNKGIELSKARNKEFRQIFDYDYYLSLDHVLRCEIQLSSFSDMRDFFKLKYDDKPTLANILNSEVDVVANELSQIIDSDIVRYGAISDRTQGSLRDKMLYAQREAICDQFDDDLKDIRQYLKYTFDAQPNAISKEMKAFKELVNERCNSVINQNLMSELVGKIGGEYCV